MNLMDLIAQLRNSGGTLGQGGLGGLFTALAGSAGLDPATLLAGPTRPTTIGAGPAAMRPAVAAPTTLAPAARRATTANPGGFAFGFAPGPLGNPEASALGRRPIMGRPTSRAGARAENARRAQTPTVAQALGR